MNSNATQGTAAGSYGAGGLIATILVWLLSLRGVAVPDNVALAMGVLLGYVTHAIAMIVIARSGKGMVVTQPAITETPSSAVKSPPLTPSI